MSLFKFYRYLALEEKSFLLLGRQGTGYGFVLPPLWPGFHFPA